MEILRCLGSSENRMSTKQIIQSVAETGTELTCAQLSHVLLPMLSLGVVERTAQAEEIKTTDNRSMRPRIYRYVLTQLGGKVLAELEINQDEPIEAIIERISTNTNDYVLCIDPGNDTGIALFINGKLALTQKTTHEGGLRMINEMPPNALVVFEDSRKMSHVWIGAGQNARVKMAMTRKIGQVDFMSKQIEEALLKRNLKYIAASAKQKGKKVAETAFRSIFPECQSRISQHERDAAMLFFLTGIPHAR